MSDFNVTLSAFGGDTLSVIAVRDAMSRFTVWGDASWNRARGAVETPGPNLITEVRYESVSIDERGDLSVLSLFGGTPFESEILVRIGEDFITMTAWADDRDAVRTTVRAFQSEFPAVDAESDPSIARGLYL